MTNSPVGQVVGPDHLVLVSPDPERLVTWYRDELGLAPERLEEWRRKEVLFVSLRVSPTFLIDIFEGERTATGRFEVEMGPADLFGAQGNGRGLYIRDPDGNRVELRTYPPR
jgi:glyoxylase I family protein